MSKEPLLDSQHHMNDGKQPLMDKQSKYLEIEEKSADA